LQILAKGIRLSSNLVGIQGFVMQDVIEESKTGRATCRICRQKIEKGELRFGEEDVNAFSANGAVTLRWYHLRCAAIARPAKLKPALAAWTAPLPERMTLDTAINEALSKAKPELPYAEMAPSGRSKCLACGETIEKGMLRVAIEREVDTGSFVTKSAGFLHPGCAAGYVGDGDFADLVLRNSKLAEGEMAELREALG
jgi:hypothetical protein